MTPKANETLKIVDSWTNSNDPSVIKATIAGFGHLNSDLDNDYIHLKDANFFNPAGERVGSQNTGVLWRGYTEEVDGFFFGRLMSEK